MIALYLLKHSSNSETYFKIGVPELPLTLSSFKKIDFKKLYKMKLFFHSKSCLQIVTPNVDSTYFAT